jgi:hypothetical protein
VVEQLGAVSRTVESSPFTNPEYVGVTSGTASPKATECEDAVMLRTALPTVIVTGVVVPSGSVANLYGVQLIFVSYRSGSSGVQSYVSKVSPDADGVQVQVAVHGDAITGLLVHPEIGCPAALKEIVPGI